MATLTYFPSEDSTVTVGATEEQCKLESDVAITGGTKNKNSRTNFCGQVYQTGKSKDVVTISFDYRETGDDTNISDMYAQSTNTPVTSPVTGTQYTMNWGDDGTLKDITIHNVTNQDGNIIDLTLTDVDMNEAPKTIIKGDITVRTFTGTADAVNVNEVTIKKTA